jgi:hypothetical protein
VSKLWRSHALANSTVEPHFPRVANFRMQTVSSHGHRRASADAISRVTLSLIHPRSQSLPSRLCQIGRPFIKVARCRLRPSHSTPPSPAMGGAKHFFSAMSWKPFVPTIRYARGHANTGAMVSRHNSISSHHLFPFEPLHCSFANAATQSKAASGAPAALP